MHKWKMVQRTLLNSSMAQGNYATKDSNEVCHLMPQWYQPKLVDWVAHVTATLSGTISLWIRVFRAYKRFGITIFKQKFFSVIRSLDVQCAYCFCKNRDANHRLWKLTAKSWTLYRASTFIQCQVLRILKIKTKTAYSSLKAELLSTCLQ